MKSILTILLINLITYTYTQKPKIDLIACDYWPTIGSSTISRNGVYLIYRIENQPIGNSTIIIQSTDGYWKKEFIIQKNTPPQQIITGDNKKAVIMCSQDSAAIVTLGGTEITYIANIQSIKFPKESKSSKLAYLLNSPDNKLIIQSLTDTIKYHISFVKDYQFSNNGENIIIVSEKKEDQKVEQEVKWVNTINGINNTIWIGSDKISNVIFDSSGKQLAFKTTSKDGFAAIWHYQSSMTTAKKVIDDADKALSGFENPLSISFINFCNKNKSLLLNISEKSSINSSTPGRVSIWGYKDERLQTDQPPASYAGIFHLKENKFIWLAKEGQRIIPLPNENWQVYSSLRNWEEMNWGISHEKSPYLISIIDGKETALPGYKQKNASAINISPDGNYIVYYDTTQQSWISYNTNNFAINDISTGVTSDWEWDTDYPFTFYNEVVGWIESQGFVLIPDKFDIWLMDLTGKNKPINITYGYGRKNHIIFRPVASIYPNKKINSLNENLLLYGFNNDTKESGFYNKLIPKKDTPILLSKGKFHDLYVSSSIDGISGIIPPVKALDSNIYILRRSKENTSINLYSTSNFKNFTLLSNVYPERSYNWFTTELHSWISYDGIKTQGIMYKPENFDSTRKYPVVFLCYDKMSNALNAYLTPALFRGDINIPWLVSHDYLVFAPDIYYKTGYPAISAYNHVVSAADYVSRLEYVDSAKLALTGISFGGYETNYIITHSNKFAAAVSASGVSDLISQYGSLWGAGGHSKQGYLELRQGRMGCTPWDCTELYIKNSPVFYANKVLTPVLMMANKKDINVPFDQGMEFFTALRRLEKKCWLLQYDDGAHSLTDKSLKEDYTIRVMQFLDHYLKDAPPPKWMRESVKAKYRIEKYKYFLELSNSKD